MGELNFLGLNNYNLLLGAQTLRAANGEKSGFAT